MIILIAIDRDYAGFYLAKNGAGLRIVLGWLAITLAHKTAEKIYHQAMHNVLNNAVMAELLNKELLDSAIAKVAYKQNNFDIDSAELCYDIETKTFVMYIGEYCGSELEPYWGTRPYADTFHVFTELANFVLNGDDQEPESEEEAIARAIAHDVEIAKQQGYQVVQVGCWHVPPCEGECKGD